MKTTTTAKGFTVEMSDTQEGFNPHWLPRWERDGIVDDILIAVNWPKEKLCSKKDFLKIICEKFGLNVDKYNWGALKKIAKADTTKIETPQKTITAEQYISLYQAQLNKMSAEEKTLLTLDNVKKSIDKHIISIEEKNKALKTLCTEKTYNENMFKEVVQAVETFNLF